MSFYSKQNRFVRRTYAVTASALLSGGAHAPPPGGRPEYEPTSGSWVFNNKQNPKRIPIQVTDKGKIVDARVWVELIHDARIPTSGGSNGGVGTMALSIRNPNVRFKHAHPLWNSQDVPRGPIATVTATGSFDSAEIYRSSYLLWDGTLSLSYAQNDNIESFTNYIADGPGYNTWDFDYDIRTVFTDSSTQLNPRHMDPLYPGFHLAGSVGFAHDLTSSLPSTRMLQLEGYPPFFNGPGNCVSWIYDTRIANPMITGSTNFTASIGLSPPRGWLNGAGGSAAVNEFNTTGSQIGPADMLPVYPLLDDVFVGEDWHDNVSFDDFPVLPLILKGSRGSRPGLRGAEAFGTWEFMIATNSSSLAPATFPLTSGSGIWFRQVRLELLLDQGEGPSFFTPSSRFRYSKPSAVPAREGERNLHVIAGVADWNTGLDIIKTSQPPVYGRTVGITDNTGSFSDFSVLSRVTGVLTDELSSADLANLQRDYLNNEFGTPYIPLSSGSGVPTGFDPLSDEDRELSRVVIKNFLDPQLEIDQESTARGHLSKVGYYTDRSTALLKLLGTAASGSS